METLAKYDFQLTSLTSARQALSILEDLKEDNNKISKRFIETSKTLKISQKLATKSKIYLILLLTTVYIFLSILAGIVSTDDWSKAIELFKISFVNAWGFHLAIVGVMVGVLALPIKKLFKSESKNE